MCRSRTYRQQMWMQSYECFSIQQNKKRTFYQQNKSFPFIEELHLIINNLSFLTRIKVFQKGKDICIKPKNNYTFLKKEEDINRSCEQLL